ncbi:MAG: 4-hydroxybutyrate CoA-transferase [Flavobacteriaceae bacterium]|jgi:acyl-CoA hydrolase|nr:4-hydroxybutyrate CoA-transferase [Flavobacteriaceae bacterium]
MDYIKASEAAKLIKSNHRIYVHSTVCTPERLIDAIVDRHEDLRDVEFCHIHTEGKARYALPEYSKNFKVNNFFIGANIRPYVNKGSVQYVPVFLSEIPLLFRKKVLPVDVALIHVSPPDSHGYCSLGLSIEGVKAATEEAKIVIAQVNPNMPRTFGDSFIHESQITAAIWCEDPIYESLSPALTENDVAIGKYVAGIVDDGATLQMGIGGIPNAVLACLGNHKNLGIHTEMFSDGLIPLVEKGIVNNSQKKIYHGKIVSTFLMGTRKLYDFVDDNQAVAMLESSYTNDTAIIRQNPKVTAINSAIEIDLTGQVCADSIATKMYSGVGGQMDFIRGASLSEGGKPIIALTSVTNKGASKIVPTLKQGAGVVTTRGHIHYVATEFGIVNLYGKNLKERAEALISIAHPNHRETLSQQAFELFEH